MTRKTVKQALDRFVRGSLDRQDVFGRTGRVNEDGSVSILVEGNSREVHVRVDGEQASTTARHENRINTDIAGLPVIMRRVHGRLTIIRTNEAQMAAFQQGAPYTPVQLLPHQVQLGHIQQIPSQTVLGNAEAGDDDVSALPALPAGVEAAIDHANIQNVGTNSHAAIDTHIADGTIHFPMPGVGDLADVEFLLSLEAVRDRGAFLVYRPDTGWDAVQSARYRVETVTDGSTLTVIPDDTIEHLVVVSAIVIATTTAPATVTNWYNWNRIDVGNSDLLFSDTGQELTIACTAGGGVTLTRTDGDNVYPRIKLWLFWE